MCIIMAVFSDVSPYSTLLMEITEKDTPYMLLYMIYIDRNVIKL